MKDAEIVPIANTRDLAKDASLSKEAWVDVYSRRDAAQEGSVELVEADASRSKGYGGDYCLRFGVRAPIPV